MYVHALHPVHAVPDLRVSGGRLRDGVSGGVVGDRRFEAYGFLPGDSATRVHRPTKYVGGILQRD